VKFLNKQKLSAHRTPTLAYVHTLPSYVDTIKFTDNTVLTNREMRQLLY